MLTYLNESDTAVVVLHEIYGLNQHIQEVCIKLSGKKMDVFAPNMLEDETVYNYDQGNIAYDNFVNCVGFERAFNQINNFICSIRNKYKRIFVIGFSIGATIAWLCSKEPELCSGVVGFYGSRIRDYHEITPKCPVLLIFPTQEESFNVSGLLKLLNTKENVYVKQLYGRHGFADPLSPNYNRRSSYQAYKSMFLFILGGPAPLE